MKKKIDKVVLFHVPSGPMISYLTEERDKLNQETIKRIEQNQQGRQQQSFANNGDPKLINPVPNENDFYAFPFRHISATIVGSGTWKSTDFRNEKVLRNSVKLLSNIKAYKNHYMAVDQEIGYVGEASWQNQSRSDDGKIIPAGINAPFIIDQVLHPQLVRKLNAPRPSVDSASVTVWFEWEPSHEFERDYDFFYHVGETIDGEEVTRVVTNIVQYDESSMVSFGADPFAKKLDDNNKNPYIDWSAVVSNSKFDKDPKHELYESERKFFVLDCHNENLSLHLKTSSSSFSKNSEENLNPMNEQLLKLVAKALNKKVEEVTEQDIEKINVVTTENFNSLNLAQTELESTKQTLSTAVEAKSVAEGKVVQLTKEIQTLKGDKTEEEIAQEKLLVEVGKKSLESLRDQAEKTYTKFAKGEPDQAIVDEIKSEESFDKLNSKIKMWGGKVVQEFSGKCSECGSTNINFGSAETQTEDQVDEPETETGNILINQFRN